MVPVHANNEGKAIACVCTGHKGYTRLERNNTLVQELWRTLPPQLEGACLTTVTSVGDLNLNWNAT